MNAWQLYKRNGQDFLSIDSWLQAGVNMAFTTRRGGSSTGPFDSCNLGLHVGDEAEKVIANRSSVFQLFQAELGKAVCCEQVHGDQIRKIDKSHQGQGAFQYEQSLPSCDGLITNVAGIFLLTFYADCIPIFFFDPIHRAVGITHSGWKGTMARIAAKTIEAMEKEYGSRSDEIYVAIGPGIAGCCFQIADDLSHKVNQAFPEYCGILHTKNSDEYYWDLPETNRQMLVNKGVKPQHISNCSLCTVCHPELFFSFRRDEGQTGRMGALIALEY